MTFDQHSLAAEHLAGWGCAFVEAAWRLFIPAVLWGYVADSLWEGVIIAGMLVPAFGLKLILSWRARWHAGRMRTHIDSMKGTYRYAHARHPLA